MYRHSMVCFDSFGAIEMIDDPILEAISAASSLPSYTVTLCVSDVLCHEIPGPHVGSVNGACPSPVSNTVCFTNTIC